MERTKEVLKAFLPILGLVVGVLIMVSAGVNNTPTTSIFKAVDYMEWWGWIGAAVGIVSLALGFIKIR